MAVGFSSHLKTFKMEIEKFKKQNEALKTVISIVDPDSDLRKDLEQLYADNNHRIYTYERHLKDQDKSHNWDFVYQFYPNYESSDEIARAGDLQKLLDGEINGYAETMLKEEYDNDPENPQIQADYDSIHREIFEEAIENFIEQGGMLIHTLNKTN